MGMFDYQTDKQDIAVPLFERLGQRADVAQEGFATEHLDPFIERTTGYVSPENKLRKIASDTDLSDGKAVQATFNTLLSKNPKAAQAWLTSIKPVIQMHMDKQGADTQAISAKASLMNALKKADPNAAEEQKIHKNIQDIYSRTFCKGGIIGSECQVPISNDRLQKKYTKTIVNSDGSSRTVVELPTPEEFALEFGINAQNIYKKRTGQAVQPTVITPPEDTEATTPAPVTQQQDTTPINIAFGLTSEETLKWGPMIQEAKDAGVSDKAILAKLNDLRAANVATQEYVVPRNDINIQPYAEPFQAPQNEEQLMFDKFGGLPL